MTSPAVPAVPPALQKPVHAQRKHWAARECCSWAAGCLWPFACLGPWAAGIGPNSAWVGALVCGTAVSLHLAFRQGCIALPGSAEYSLALLLQILSDLGWAPPMKITDPSSVCESYGSGGYASLSFQIWPSLRRPPLLPFRPLSSQCRCCLPAALLLLQTPACSPWPRGSA